MIDKIFYSCIFCYILYLFVTRVSIKRVFLRSKTLSKGQINNAFITLKKWAWTVAYKRNCIVLLWSKFSCLSLASPSFLKVNRLVAVMMHGVGRKRPCLIFSGIAMFGMQKLRKFTETSVGMSGIANNVSWTLSMDAKLGIYTMILVYFEDYSPGELHGRSFRTAFRKYNGNAYFVSFMCRQWTPKQYVKSEPMSLSNWLPVMHQVPRKIRTYIKLSFCAFAFTL